MIGCDGASGDSAVGEVIQLQNKLEELQTKKKKIDQMVAQFNNGASNLTVSNPVIAASGVGEFFILQRI